MDDGALRALRDRRKSLFSAGITSAQGDFSAQDAVSLCDSAGVEFARGLVNFTAEVGGGADAGVATQICSARADPTPGGWAGGAGLERRPRCAS
jgi:glutamate 5-kinase